MEQRELMNYIEAMKETSHIIGSKEVDHLVVPMLGSVPFIDTMTIVDDDFDPTKAVYMPASSRIEDVNSVIREWYINFLDDVVDIDSQNFPVIMGSDEVVSGASVMRCFYNIDLATQGKRKRIRQDLMSRLHTPDPEVSIDAMDKIDMLSNNQHSHDIGIMRDRVSRGVYKIDKDIARQDSKFMVNLIRKALDGKLIYQSVGVEDAKGKVTKEYNTMKEEGRVIPVPVDKIITMDQPWLCPPRFRTVPGAKDGDYAIYTPEVYDFKGTPSYVEFLSAVARVVGKDPAKIAPVNMQAILDSNKYLNREI